VDEAISDVVFEQLERKGCSVESEKRRCSRNFPVENIDIVHHVFFRIAFHECHCAAPWKSWLRIRNDALSSDQNSTSFSAAQVFMRAQKGKIYLVVNFQVQLMVAAVSSTINGKQYLFVLSCFFLIE
jgi:hypothetical protein